MIKHFFNQNNFISIIPVFIVTLDHCCIDDGLRRLLIMCYGADRLVRCEAKKGDVRKKHPPQCFTDFKACFSTQLTDGLR
jgi:hypothetical protein